METSTDKGQSRGTQEDKATQTDIRGNVVPASARAVIEHVHRHQHIHEHRGFPIFPRVNPNPREGATPKK